MSTTKKPVATLAKKEETKAAPVAEVKAEVKAAEVKTEVKETAKKEAKASVKKAAAKTTAKKATEAKASAKKETVKKETTAKAAKVSKTEVKIAVQFADKSYTSEDLANIANDVWVYDHNKKASELKDVQLYVKPEESKVYYVFNDEITGDFNI